MDADPYPSAMGVLANIAASFDNTGLIIGLLIVILLLIMSAMISGAEVAYFSLSPKNIKELKTTTSRTNSRILSLLGKPERLLATILISNNFVNVAIVILSTFLTDFITSGIESQALVFVLKAVVITFVILLFGEILPKVYAAQFSLKFASFMALPLFVLDKLFKPLSVLLVGSTSIVNRRLAKKKGNLSMDDLSQALDITAEELKEEEKILKGIVKFGNIDVKEIMTPRLDVVGIDISEGFKKLLSVIIDSGYSRIPVYEENLDNLKGVLYIKDLLPHLNREDEFNWRSLMREPYFVHEAKKIDDLLEDFQKKKIHMAAIVDEYGGMLGVITLEDVLEEIVGEINDESDESEVHYEKIDERTFVFEGKTLLNDFYKDMNLLDDLFDSIKGDAETLAGLILELKGEIPEKNEEIEIEGFLFKIKSVDDRRIKKIQVTLK